MSSTGAGPSGDSAQVPGDVVPTTAPHTGEPHLTGFNDRLNWLRASVLGANDGIVSIAGIVLGVAGATSDRSHIGVAAMAGVVAGALSMGAGEYVSVSTQRDSEEALLARERRELVEDPQDELAELAGIYVEKGLEPDLALEVARQLTAKDALGAHAEAELGIDPDDLTSAWKAAVASMVAFVVGALLPALTILLVTPDLRIWVTMGAVTVALAITGWSSARFGYGSAPKAVLRNVAGGLLAMVVTYSIGTAVGTQV